MKKIGSWIIISVLVFSLLPSLLVNTLDNVVATDSQVWENEYGKLEVWPSTSTNLIRQKQWYNMTWYYPDNTIDIAFGFDEPLSHGQIYYWNGNDYVKVTTNHVEYNDKHFYVLNNINVVQDETKHGYWEYDVKANSSGKWDMYAKLSSDSWSTAFSSGRIIHLDPWWDSDWSYRKDIYIDHTQVGLGVSGFPVYVNISDAEMVDDVQGDLGDIVFVDDTNSTTYPHQIEYYNVGATIEARIWVNVSQINGSAHSGDTHLNMYYKNPTCGNQWAADLSTVWDTSKYIAVYHMNASTGGTKVNGVYDSSGNNNHATFNGTLPSQTTGVVGYGQSLDGNNDWLYLPSGCDATLDGTWEIWANVNKTSNPEALFMCYYDVNNHIRIDARDDVNRWDCEARYTGGDGWSNTFADEANAPSNTWDNVMTHWDDGGTESLWVNGSKRATDPFVNSVLYPSFNKFYIGVDYNEGNNFDGVIDEIRISKVKHNDSWMEASYNTVYNDTGFVSIGQELSETGGTPPNHITGLTATTMSLTNITLDWTKSSNADYTYVEYNTISDWNRGEGTLIYNGTNNNHSEWNLTARTQYHFRAWAFNDTDSLFSTDVSASNHTGPTNPTNIATDIDGNTLNFTWTKGPRSSNTIIMRKTTGCPSVIGDGTEIYNGSATGFDDIAFTTSNYYTIFAHNSTVHLSSLGEQVEWGVLRIQVYDENTTDSIRNFTVFVTNQSGSEAYEIYSDGSQSVNIDINDLPTGNDVAVKVNGSVYINATTTHSYEDRVYYMDISPNTFYNLTAYLPRIIDSYLYRLTVVGPKDQYNADPPIEDATVDIKRYINSTSGWDSIGTYLTDGDGNIYVHLIPGEFYKVTTSATNYLTGISNYIPSSSVFEQTFRLATASQSDTTTYDDFWENISIDITMTSAGCMQDGNITITYLDSNSSTTNTEMQLWEIHGNNNTLLNTWANTSSSFFNINGSINTTRMHYLVLFFNNTADFLLSQPIVISIPNVDMVGCGIIDPIDLDKRFSDVFGDIEIGDAVVPWSNFLSIIIPLFVLMSFGPYNTGLGIIGAGISMVMIRAFLDTLIVGGFNWVIIGSGVFIIIIGIIYMMTKGRGDDRL